jgi:acyl carrier protein
MNDSIEASPASRKIVTESEKIPVLGDIERDDRRSRLQTVSGAFCQARRATKGTQANTCPLLRRSARDRKCDRTRRENAGDEDPLAFKDHFLLPPENAKSTTGFPSLLPRAGSDIEGMLQPSAGEALPGVRIESNLTIEDLTASLLDASDIVTEIGPDDPVSLLGLDSLDIVEWLFILEEQIDVIFDNVAIDELDFSAATVREVYVHLSAAIEQQQSA